MTEDEEMVLEEFKELRRTNAEVLSKRLRFPIRYIQILCGRLHEAGYLKVDTLARYPMYQIRRLIINRKGREVYLR